MNNDEAQRDDVYKPSGEITLKIEKFSELAREGKEARRVSDPIYVRGIPWNILAKPCEEKDTKYLGFYLQCNTENQDSKWRCQASAKLKLLAKEGEEEYIREIEHTFNAKQNDWGFAQFKKFEELLELEPYEGWYDKSTNSITLSVEIM